MLSIFTYIPRIAQLKQYKKEALLKAKRHSSVNKEECRAYLIKADVIERMISSITVNK